MNKIDKTASELEALTATEIEETTGGMGWMGPWGRSGFYTWSRDNGDWSEDVFWT